MASIRVPGTDKDWVQCWEIASGKTLSLFKGHLGQITSLTFSPDSKYLLSGGEEKTARLWREGE